MMPKLAAISLVLAAIATPVHADPRPKAKGLSRVEARRRADRIHDVRYKLHFDLDATAPNFTGTVVTTFAASKADEPLTIDFDGGKVAELMVNGAKLSPIDYNGRFLSVPAAKLKDGANVVSIRFSHPYSSNGQGLYRFKDPEDGKLYLYTDFEPYEANRLFPAFDQPDLKATYTLTVDAPARWQVISSARESGVTPAKGGKKNWQFPETKRFSTYLFSLHAGDYKVWEASAGDIPLRLFARQSMVKYVDAEEWFTFTRQGLAFYQSYFDFPYPFGKFDQVLVPDFNAGAMENVAAITYSERYFPRGPSTRENRRSRAGVILHEMAHQWFGDLVTMAWWNDLWLNESFATYMSSLAEAEATEFKDSWLDFFGEKSWAYWEDQLVTTHPIEGVVPDTEQAFANFDGITYGKGASVLKQLNLYLGPDKFKDGVRGYFKKHQYGNAMLTDFIASLAAASGQDLAGWSDDWLRTSGVNRVEAVYACAAGKVASFALTQTASDDEKKTLRAHRTVVGLYGESNGAITLAKAVPVLVRGASTPVPEMVGETCPAMVFPNQDDYDYAKVKLDPASLALVKSKVDKIGDPHLRLMVWHSLWEMVRDGELPVTEYADTALSQLPGEKEIAVLTPVLQNIYGRRRGNPGVISYLPDDGDAGQRHQFLEKAAALFASQARAADAGSDQQKLWYDSLIRLGEFPAAKVPLQDWLSGKEQLKGLAIDQDRRWSLIYQLGASGSAQAEALRRAELKRDRSASGEVANIEAEAGRTDKASKDRWYAQIVDPKTKHNLAHLKAAMRGLYPNGQWRARAERGPRFFADLDALAKTRDGEFLAAFASSLAPATCDAASVQALAGFLAGHAALPPVALKALRVAHQEDERCVKIRALAAGRPKPA